MSSTAQSSLTSASLAMKVMARALHDPRPTTNARDEHCLAAALGYPPSWRVVRKVESTADNPQPLLVDRIYAGNPKHGVDVWFHHAAAHAAALTWEEGTSKGFEHRGGHLLPKQAKFHKGDKVQVLYEGDWYDATIQKKPRAKDNDFLYSVYYPKDESKQANVSEKDIRPLEVVNTFKTAVELGLPEGWQAKASGKNRWNIHSPTGEAFRSLKAALAACRPGSNAEETAAAGDPPWRTSGHDYLGREVLWTSQHQVSKRRSIKIEQRGTIVGYIDETDVDKQGNPGFVKDGVPAKLFHVVFSDDPNHPYAYHLLQSQDLEEEEVQACLVDEEAAESPKKKRARKK